MGFFPRLAFLTKMRKSAPFVAAGLGILVLVAAALHVLRARDSPSALPPSQAPGKPQTQAAQSDYEKEPSQAGLAGQARTALMPDGFSARITLSWQVRAPSPSIENPMSILVVSGTGANTRTITATALVWEGMLPPDEYQVQAMTSLDGTFDVVSSNAISQDHPDVLVNVMTTGSWELTVTDAHTGLHLSDVSLMALPHDAESPTSTFAAHQAGPPPSEAVTVPCEKTSPIQVSESAAPSCWFWVGSPGHAWTSFLRSPRQKRVRIALCASGTLDIHVGPISQEMLVSRSNGAVALTPIQVLVEGPSDMTRETREFLTGGSEERILDNLPAGRYSLRARASTVEQVGVVLAQETVTVQPGERETVTITPSWPNGESSLIVTVVAATEVSRDNRECSLAMYSEKGGPWRFAFRESLTAWEEIRHNEVFMRHYRYLEPGKYLAQLEPVGGQHIVVLEPGQPVEMTLEASDIVVLTVNLYDAEHQRMRRGWLRRVYEDDLALDQVCTFPYSPGMQLLCRSVPMELQAFAEGLASKPTRVEPACQQAKG